MNNYFKIEEAIAEPAKLALKLSKPIFFLDEERGQYKATIKCLDIEDKLVSVKEVVFTQEEYDNWGIDNEYIYDLICDKLSFKRIKE